MSKINKFRGDYAFLSNFYPCIIHYKEMTFRCSEAMFQSFKCRTREDAEMFQDFDGLTSKRMSHKIKVRDDWYNISISAMYITLKEKFTQNPALKEKLLATGDSYLEEGNTWNDKFWGVSYGVGENYLGKLLMLVRKELLEGKY